MTAKLIRYIRFSLYNSLDIILLRVWNTLKTQGISFCQISKHPAGVTHQFAAPKIGL